MASTTGLVPITRAFLAKFYDKYPFPPLAPEVASLSSSLKEHALRIHAERPDEELITLLNFSLPHKIDENTWRNREQVEEILFLFNKENWPSSLKAPDTPLLESVAPSLGKLEEMMESLFMAMTAFQTSSGERIFNMVLSYMPQDFRSTLMKQQRERSERRRQADVDALMLAGGSIHDKYSLLWKQQMERRMQLAQLGAASGVFKTLVKWFVGVPQVLLDFVCQINEDHGPMEVQRERYGPPLYELTGLVTNLRVLVALWWSSFEEPLMPTHELLGLLEQSVKVYTSEFKRFLVFMGEVFENSPFLISREEAGIADGADAVNDFKETTIAAGKTHEVLMTVDCEGSLVAWDFRLTAGKDVGFSVEFVDASKTKLPMLPYQRYEAHQGNFYSPSVGCYKLIWDNSYSTFYRKSLRYKVDTMPPVLGTQELDAVSPGPEKALTSEVVACNEESPTVEVPVAEEAA